MDTSKVLTTATSCSTITSSGDLGGTEYPSVTLESPKDTLESYNSIPDVVRSLRDSVSPFRDPKINRRYLRGLFREFDKDTAIYTLRDKDLDGFLSLYRLYMECGDLTEYEFGEKYLESYQHWMMLVECTWFKEHIQRWRTELELKIKAEALREIARIAKEDGRNKYDALKYLVNKSWIDKESEPSRRGRPSKAEIAKATAEEVFSEKQIREDMARLTTIPQEVN